MKDRVANRAPVLDMLPVKSPMLPCTGVCLLAAVATIAWVAVSKRQRQLQQKAAPRGTSSLDGNSSVAGASDVIVAAATAASAELAGGADSDSKAKASVEPSTDTIGRSDGSAAAALTLHG